VKEIMSVLFENRQLVVPGELLAEGDFKVGEGTFRENNKIFASQIGLATLKGKTIYVTALAGSYMPHVGDIVIGKVYSISLTSWQVDICSPYAGILHISNVVRRPFNAMKSDLREIFDIGDIIVTKVIAFDRLQDPALTVKGRDLGKLRGGTIIEIPPSKIPRLIGRKGSMINMIKEQTHAKIVVGQNGRIWIVGKRPGDEIEVIRAIRKIEREAHTTGLTDRVRELFVE
jgi:exosome complex component RRP4